MYLRIWLKAEFESTSCHLLEMAGIFSKIQGGSAFAYGLIRRDFNPTTTHFTNILTFCRDIQEKSNPCVSQIIFHIAYRNLNSPHYVLTCSIPRCKCTHLGGTWMSRFKLGSMVSINGLQLQYTPFISRL